jgi:single-strand DNA-binding protein
MRHKKEFIMGINLTIIEGHLGADPILKNTNTNNVPVCNIRVATNRKWNNAQNQLVEDTQWHNVVCWNKIAQTVAQFMHKGSHVLVEGRLQTREFMGQTTYENGQPVVDGAGQPIMVKRYTTEIVASSVTFLDKKPAVGAYAQPAAAVAAPVYAAAAPAAVLPAAPAAAPAAAPVYAAAAPGTVIPPGGYVVAAAAPAAPPLVVAADPNAVQATFIQPVDVAPPAGV